MKEIRNEPTTNFDDIIRRHLDRQNQSPGERREQLIQETQDMVDALFNTFSETQSVDVFFDHGMTLARYRELFGDLAFQKIMTKVRRHFKAVNTPITGFIKGVEALFATAKGDIDEEINPSGDFDQGDGSPVPSNVESFSVKKESQAALNARATWRSLNDLVDAGVLPPLPVDVPDDILIPPIRWGEFADFVEWTESERLAPDGKTTYSLYPKVIMSVMIPIRKVTSRNGLIRYAEVLHLSVKKQWVTSYFDFAALQNKKTFTRTVHMPMGTRIEEPAVGYDLLLHLIARAPLSATEAERPGWNEDFTDFVSGTRSLSHDEPLVLPSLEGEVSIVAEYKERGSFEAWKKAAQRYVVDRNGRYRGVPLLVLGASVGGPILGRLANIESIIINIASHTGSGKTTVARLGASAWGNPNGIKGSWHNTRVGVERLLGATRNSLTYLDESGILLEQGNKGVKDLGQMVYWIASSTGKGRGAKHGGMQKQETWGQVILSTAEIRLTSLPPFAGKGTQSRVIDIVEPPFGTNSPEIHQMIEEVESILVKNYGHLGMMMVGELASMAAEEVEEQFRKMSNVLEHKLIESGLERHLVSRLSKNWSVVFMGLTYVVKVLGLDLVQAQEVAIDSMLASAGLLKGDSLRFAVLRALQHWVMANLITDGDGVNSARFEQKGIAAEISKDGSEVRIIPQALVDLLADHGYQIPDIKKLTELLEAHGVADYKVARIKNSPMRAYVISMKRLNDALEIGNGDVEDLD